MRAITAALTVALLAGCGAAPAETQATPDVSVVTADSGTVDDSGATSDVTPTDAGADVAADTGSTFLAPGTIALTWTVDSEPASTGCPAGSVVVVQFGIGSPMTVPCSDGAYTSPEPASRYGFTLTLVSGTETIDTLSRSVSIGPNVTTVVAVDFTTADR